MTRASQNSCMESMESLSRSIWVVPVQGKPLNILSDRLTTPKNTKVTGAVLANNQPISSIDYKSSVGFVMQDILLDTMTARECLPSLPTQRHTRHSQSSGRSLVRGVETDRHSDKKRRRVSTAEMIGDPSVISLDGTRTSGQHPRCECHEPARQSLQTRNNCVSTIQH